MRNAAIVIILLLVTGCGVQSGHFGKVKKKVVKIAAQKSQPVIDLPIDYYYRNPDGSCVHCAWCTLLEQNNMHDMAAWWRQRYHGGESASGLRSKANAAGIVYADTVRGEVAFVEWACRTGRGCLVNDMPGHVRTLMGLDNTHAYIKDNNGSASRVIVYPRDQWLRMWRGWAATPVYSPTPPATHM